MKKKFLFFIDLVMSQFGLSYQLQQKLDSDFFAIIDTPNNPKEMFLNQRIVNFKKTWFFHDQIKRSKEKIDFEYLENFEEKYNIDLWKLVINERHFYKFNKFYKFTTNEILKILEQECKFFECLINEIKPDYLLINEPSLHYQKLLVELCKAKEIKIFCLCISKFENTTIIVENTDTFDLPQNLDLMNLEKTERVEKNYSNFNKLNKNWTDNRTYGGLNKLKALKDYILISDSKNVESNFTYYGRKKHKVILNTILFYINRQIRYNFLQKKSKKNIDLTIPFVYFPLGIDDDIALLHEAPLFTDQVEIIKHVAKSLPIDHKLFVKEHSQAVFRGWKPIKQYQDIIDMPNVSLIHPSFSAKELIKNCNLLVTIRGSSSLEAAYENKPSIIFGTMPHDMLPSVYKINSLKELPELIKTALNTKIDSSYIKKYNKLIKGKIVNFYWDELEILRNKEFFSGNILSDVKFKESKVKEFFKKTDSMFKILSDAHLEKMKSN
jgi:hypothetical protein